MTNKRPISFKVFVSSRDELVDIRATTEEAIKDLRFIPILADTLHQGPSTQHDHWVKLAKDSDLTILIVDTKDSQFVRQEIDACHQSGKKVLMLRKVEKERDRELEDFIKTMEQDVFISDFRTCVELRDKIQLGVLSELVRKYAEKPQVIDGRVQSYKFAIDLINRTRKKLFLVTRTLPIITPPRKNDRDDVEFCRSIKKWIDNWLLKNSSEFYCFYCVDQTRDEIREHDLDISSVIANLKKYKDLEDETDYRFKISSIKNFNYPLIIGDEASCVWTFISRKSSGMGISCRCKETAERLVSFMERNFVQYGKPLKQLVEELGIQQDA